jgi:Rrf2 family protein
LQSGEIARRQQIPGPFLDQVLMTLRRAGLIDSVRGPHGGHRLARPADEVRLDEVIACLEGGPRETRQRSGADGDSRVLASVTEQAERAAQDVFASHTLADCVRLRATEPPVFHGIFKPAPSRTSR